MAAALASAAAVAAAASAAAVASAAATLVHWTCFVYTLIVYLVSLSLFSILYLCAYASFFFHFVHY